MTWAPGTRIGPYEIVGPLGAGGMGEVYRARDARLQREVALKVLPQVFFQDPERRARFEREARLLASINHPNIAAIYGVEDADTGGGRVPVLVLELVEGDTLAARPLPMPFDEAKAIGLQIAEALEAAHERGIIHRDLKPANVKVTPDGKVKVLDFGLAKAMEADSPSGVSDPAMSPTFTSPATELGMIMGTAAYMSPEQARGKFVDRRADIWAFGALLFELLSGTRAYPGETVSDTLAAVLRGDPDWTKLPKTLPAPAVQLLHRCLERDPRQRLQAIGEARIALAAADDGPARVTVVRNRFPSWSIAAMLVVVALAGTAGAIWARRGSTTAAPVLKVDLALDDLELGLTRTPVISPDGKQLVYSAADRLWVRSLTEFTSKPLPGAERGEYPFWSPDSQEVGFVRDRTLWRVGVNGPSPNIVGKVPDDMTGSAAGAWTDAGTFVVVGSDSKGLYEILKDGVGRELVPISRDTEADFHEVSALPGGRGLLFTVHTTEGADTIATFADGRRTDILRMRGEMLRSPAYVPPGYLMFTRETTIRGVWAVPFSLETLRTEGQPFLVTPNTLNASFGGDAMAIVRMSEKPSDLVWIDRQGGQLKAGSLQAGQSYFPASTWPAMTLSPDGQRLAVSLNSAAGDEVWIYDIVRGLMSPASRGAQMAVAPRWTPDGSRIMFAAFAGARSWNVHSVPANETHAPQRLLPPNDEPQWPCAVSPDGKWLIYGQSLSRNADLWVTPMDKSSAPRPLLTTPAREREAVFSPDGKWIAYTSDESGGYELYVRAFPIAGDRVRVSVGGAQFPSWGPDGRELLYQSDRTMMSVKLSMTGAIVDPAPPQRLFSLPDSKFYPQYAMPRDAQRFLFARAGGDDHVSLVLNWKSAIPPQ